LAQTIKASASRPQYITGRRSNDRLCDRCLPQLHTTASEVIVIAQFVKYLRETAQSCVDLAHVCPHLSTSQGLEVLATDLMAKAKELESLNMD